MQLIEKYVRTDFKSYEDFKKNYKVSVPDDFNFGFDIVDEIANKTPDKKAMIWCNENNDEAVFTFKDIKEKSAQSANFFKSLGVKKGDRVLLMLMRRYEYWFCCVGLHKLGAIVVPGTHLLTPKDIIYRVKKAQIKVIAAAFEQRIIDMVNTAKKALPNLRHIICANKKIRGWIDYTKELPKFSTIFNRPAGKAAIKKSDPFLLYFTSGTTGMPKMVVHDYSYPLGHILTAKFWQNLNPDSLHLTVAETGWGKASWGKIYGQWICESCIFVYDFDRFNYKGLLERIAKYKLTSFCAPPTVYRYMIKEDISKYNLSNLKHAQTAGEPLNPEVFNKFKEMTGLEIREGFGQTETVCMIATFPWLKPKAGSLGKPSAGWDVDVVDADNKSCPPHQEGSLIIRTHHHNPVGLFSGYYKDPKLTLSIWDKGIYNTGDKAYKDKDGYFYFIGRADDVIKSSGYRIGPFEVESALMEHPAVLECAITAVPDEIRGFIVKATVILAKGYKDRAGGALVKELQDHVKKTTAPYKYPRIIEFVDELPKTISGKIKRKHIREADKKRKFK
jgi:acetyl-CoA synthetase